MPDELLAALKREAKRRNTSLNQTAIELLQQALGVTRTRSNGIARLAGGYSEAEYEPFLEAIEPFERVEPELWK